MSTDQSFGYDMSYKVSSKPNAKNINMHIGEIPEIPEIQHFSAEIRPFSGDKNEPFQVDMSYKAEIQHVNNIEAKTWLWTEYGSRQNQNKVEGIVAGQSGKPNMTYEVKGIVTGKSGESVKPDMTYDVKAVVDGKSQRRVSKRLSLKDERVVRDGVSYKLNISDKRNM